jgi:hypothetical protein
MISLVSQLCCSGTISITKASQYVIPLTVEQQVVNKKDLKSGSGMKSKSVVFSGGPASGEM